MANSRAEGGWRIDKGGSVTAGRAEDGRMKLQAKGGCAVVGGGGGVDAVVLTKSYTETNFILLVLIFLSHKERQ